MKWRFGLFLIALMLLVYAIGLFTMPVAAAPDAVTLEIQPASVALFVGEKADVLVILNNPTSNAISELQLSSVAPNGIEISWPASIESQVIAGSSVSWRVQISRKEDTSLTGPAIFQVEYSWKDENTQAIVKGYTTAKLDIQPSQPVSLDKLVKLSVVSTTNLLQEKLPVAIHVIVQNLADFPITVTAIQPVVPDFIALYPSGLQNQVEISPLGSQRFLFQASLKTSYQSAAQNLPFTVQLEWKQNGQTFTGSQIILETMQVGALGDLNGILQVIGVPSFMLIPGFLVITMFAFLWSHLPPKIDLQLTVKSNDFWMWVILGSIFAAPLYRWLTGLFGTPHDYLVTYGLTDIAWVWIGSIAAGIPLYLLIFGFRKVSFYKVPLPEDPPITILNKIERNGLGLDLEQVESSTRPGKRYLQLMPVANDSNKTWIVPFIQCQWKKGSSGDLIKQFDILQNNPNDVSGLIKFLTDPRNKQALLFGWENGERPFQEDFGKLTHFGVSRIMRNPR